MNAFLNQKYKLKIKSRNNLELLMNFTIITKKLQIKHGLDCQFKD